MARKKKVEEPVEEVVKEETPVVEEVIEETPVEETPVVEEVIEEIPVEEVEVEKGHWVETVDFFGRHMVFVKDE